MDGEDRREVFYRIVPGQNFLLSDGSPSESATSTSASSILPMPGRTPTQPASILARSSRRPHRSTWILVDDDDNEDRILDTAVKLGATELWRHHYWA